MLPRQSSLEEASVEFDEAVGTLAGSALSRSADAKPVLLGGHCGRCGTSMFPKAPVCPSCMSEDIAIEEMPRTGQLYAFTTVHAGPKRWNKPFTVGYVDLANGVRVFSHIVGERPSIGDTVQLGVAVVGMAPDGTALRSFVFGREGAPREAVS